MLVGGGVPLLADTVEDADQVGVTGAEDLLEAEALVHLDLAAVGGADGDQRIGGDDAGLERVEEAVEKGVV